MLKTKTSVGPKYNVFVRGSNRRVRPTGGRLVTRSRTRSAKSIVRAVIRMKCLHPDESCPQSGGCEPLHDSANTARRFARDLKLLLVGACTYGVCRSGCMPCSALGCCLFV